MEWNRAKESFDIAIKKDPSYIKAYPKKGDCHFAMKEYHKALETYEAGLKIDSANELCKEGLMKTQRAIYTSGSATTEEEKMERAKRGMADPEIKKILQTPEVMNALQDLQNNPAAIQNIMKNPDLALKIEKLIQAGIIGTT
jgi:stress-induced-phosphoprotein 1